MENIHDNKISGIGNAVCETVLPAVPLQPLKEIKEVFRKNIEMSSGHLLYVH